MEKTPPRRYPKINTVWKRGPKGAVIENDFSKEEFIVPNLWLLTEKIDGMNIRIVFEKGIDPLTGEYCFVSFHGRKENSMLPGSLLKYLNDTFTIELFEKVFSERSPIPDNSTIILFGEGYGPGIQKGGKYRKDQSFMLFDILVSNTWVRFDDIMDIADKMGINHVPRMGVFNLNDAIDIVRKRGTLTMLVDKYIPEGIVATSYPMVLMRDGDPLRWKLKDRDLYRKKKIPKTPKVKKAVEESG